MDSRFLESLICVIETGSIAQAARLQHLTAAAISQRLKTLEVELGAHLFSRTGHCAKPTEACDRILARARHIVKEVAVLEKELRSGSFFSPIRIGVIPSQWSQSLPIDLEELRDRTPGTRIGLSVNTSHNLYTGLIEGKFDAVVIEAPEFVVPRGICSYVLRREALVLISNRKENKPIREILVGSHYIEYLPDPFASNIVAKFLADSELVLTPICNTGSLDSIKSLVREGAGVSIVPKWPGIEMRCKNLVVTELKNGDYSRDIVLLVSDRSDQREFFERLRETLERR